MLAFLNLLDSYSFNLFAVIPTSLQFDEGWSLFGEQRHQLLAPRRVEAVDLLRMKLEDNKKKTTRLKFGEAPALSTPAALMTSPFKKSRLDLPLCRFPDSLTNQDFLELYSDSL